MFIDSRTRGTQKIQMLPLTQHRLVTIRPCPLARRSHAARFETFLSREQFEQPPCSWRQSSWLVRRSGTPHSSSWLPLDAALPLTFWWKQDPSLCLFKGCGWCPQRLQGQSRRSVCRNVLRTLLCRQRLVVQLHGDEGVEDHAEKDVGENVATDVLHADT